MFKFSKVRVFSQIPDGLTQGSWTADKLQKESQTWGSELYAAGVNFDLAPVADQVLSADFAPQNAPIGYWSRQYAYDKASIISHAQAFTEGMKAAKVLTTAKHFSRAWSGDRQYRYQCRC
jgi:beta-N-acetylhexosaminidase